MPTFRSMHFKEYSGELFDEPLERSSASTSSVPASIEGPLIEIF